MELMSHDSKRRVPLLPPSSTSALLSLIHFMAVLAFSSDRQSMTTVAPRLYRSFAVSFPMPALAPAVQYYILFDVNMLSCDMNLPVITTTFPSSLAGFSDPFIGGILSPSIMVNA